MKIALLGYGRMGRVIDSLALERNHEVVARFDVEGPDITEASLQGAKVCIDFSHPDALLQHVGTLCDLQRNIVIGTTGWEAHLHSVKSLVDASSIGAIYSPNFSIGMALFRKVVEEASTLFGKIHGYDVAGLEIHHAQKGDSPSGSAQALSRAICSQFPDKEQPEYERIKTLIQPESLHFASVRCGSFPGTHTVLFDSTSDTVELTHRARNREGFALGALVAAEWIEKRRGFYHLDDLVEALVHEGAR